MLHGLKLRLYAACACQITEQSVLRVKFATIATANTPAAAAAAAAISLSLKWRELHQGKNYRI